MLNFKIVLDELEIKMFLGIHQIEKDVQQRVLVSVEIAIECDIDSDAPAFDYDAVTDHIRSYAGRHIATQEELVTRIHAFVTEADAVRHARIHSKKPDVYPDCTAIGVVFEG